MVFPLVVLAFCVAAAALTMIALSLATCYLFSKCIAGGQKGASNALAKEEAVETI
jgi:uncharacterized membrane protein